VVSVVVPLMVAVLPNARGRGFDSRSRLLGGRIDILTVNIRLKQNLVFESIGDIRN
jgi:hypothetical protein